MFYVVHGSSQSFPQSAESTGNKLETVLRGKRKEKGESDRHYSAKKLRGSKSQERITVAVTNPTIEFEDKASTVEVTAPHHATQA